MRKVRVVVIVVMALMGVVGGATTHTTNWNGWGDTSTVWVDSVGTTVYTGSYSLTDGEDCRVLLLVDDTSSAGFADDSIQVQWGYQTWSWCLNSSGVVDTCFDVPVVLDTAKNDSLGKMETGSVAANGDLTRTLGQLDTTYCAGFAVQSRWFVPEWDTRVRFWATGLTGNNASGAGVKARFQFTRRQYTQTRAR